jgi:hypothetical protein
MKNCGYHHSKGHGKSHGHGQGQSSGNRHGYQHREDWRGSWADQSHDGDFARRHAVVAASWHRNPELRDLVSRFASEFRDLYRHDSSR